MTRANINYIGKLSPKGSTKLFFYWNGDQYPRGIDKHYQVREFLDSDWSPKAFKDWAIKNYRDENDGKEYIVKVKKIDQPKIYYTGDFITDYSYIFDNSLGDKKIRVYCWDELTFSGNVDKFKKWLDKQALV